MNKRIKRQHVKINIQINIKKHFDQLHDDGFLEPVSIPHRGCGDGWNLYKYV